MTVSLTEDELKKLIEDNFNKEDATLLTEYIQLRDRLDEIYQRLEHQVGTYFDLLSKARNEKHNQIDNIDLSDAKTETHEDWEKILSNYSERSNQARAEIKSYINRTISSQLASDFDVQQLFLFKDIPLEEQVQLKQFDLFLQALGKVNILERTLSENGCYFLSFKNRKYILNVLTYGYTSTVASFKSVEEALNYTRENHWYKKHKGEKE